MSISARSDPNPVSEIEVLRSRVAELEDEAQRLRREINRSLQSDSINSGDALQRLLEQLPVGIQVFDSSGVCLRVNQTHLEIFGVSNPEKLIGAYNIFTDPMADEHGTAEAARRALMGETINLGDKAFNFQHADPRYARTSGRRIINVTIFPVFDPLGNVVNIVGLNYDVSDQRQAEMQRLELAVQTERIKLLEETIADVSHDLKTPLAIINTSLYLLHKHAKPEQLRYVERLESQVGRLGKLIDGLITMSRLSHAVELKLEAVNLNRLMQTVAEVKLPLAQEKNIEVTFILSDDLPDALADEDEILRVFDNLIDNAVYYTPSGGHVVLHSDSDDEDVIIDVVDDGVGIAPLDLPHIFKRFYRADKARATDTGGTGLGLAIVKRIIDMHGGTIEVTSAVNNGTRFRVRLPRAR